jgi:hypothetical protein
MPRPQVESPNCVRLPSDDSRIFNKLFIDISGRGGDRRSPIETCRESKRRSRFGGRFQHVPDWRKPVRMRRMAGFRSKKHMPEQPAALLWQIEVGIANRKGTPPACQEVEIA